MHSAATRAVALSLLTIALALERRDLPKGASIASDIVGMYCRSLDCSHGLLPTRITASGEVLMARVVQLYEAAFAPGAALRLLALSLAA